jgi:class 3 adenylate cyclase
MERRLAAIVAADVANYSILIGQNELETLTELNRLQDEVLVPAIKQYHGRIVRLTGDGSLLAFNSALHAVKFAVDVQRMMAERKTSNPSDIQIDFRMGANLGDIIQARNDIHGEGINVAVRLEELAPPGGICLSHSIYIQTKNALGEHLLPIGERHLKNIAEPVLVWRWQPPGSGGALTASGAQQPASRAYHGRQILDPKVTSLLVDLHLRSAKLALSEAFDIMLARPDGGRRVSLPDIHRTIGESLAAASELLIPIRIERSAKGTPPRPPRLAGPQSMSDFLSDAFEGGDMFFALNMLRRIQASLRLRVTEMQKRRAFMRLTQELLHEARLDQIKASIRFAFVDP